MNAASESTWARYIRKFKEQPLIPLGVIATCFAFAGASRQYRSGNRASFNRWMRFRVIAQGFTVAAVVMGGWSIAQERKAAAKNEAVIEEARREKAERERERFEARMKDAEEAHRFETEGWNKKP